MVDAPLILNKDAEGYVFDKKVVAFYYGMVDRFVNERTTHVMRPFGCDMAYVDAKINYRIMDELMRIWDELELY